MLCAVVANWPIESLPYSLGNCEAFGKNNTAVLFREMMGGLENLIEVSLHASSITVGDLRLNEHRFATLLRLKQAKKKAYRIKFTP